LSTLRQLEAKSNHGLKDANTRQVQPTNAGLCDVLATPDKGSIWCCFKEGAGSDPPNLVFRKNDMDASPDI
jgi:hypothetical protein